MKDPADRNHNPPPPPAPADDEGPGTWADEGGAGDYAGGPVTSSGRRKRQGPPGSKT
jgi:hypothetical protein